MEPKMNEHEEARQKPMDFSLTDELIEIQNRPLRNERILELEKKFNNQSDYAQARYLSLKNMDLSEIDYDSLIDSRAAYLLSDSNMGNLINEYYDFFYYMNKDDSEIKGQIHPEYFHPNYDKFIHYNTLILDVLDDAIRKKEEKGEDSRFDRDNWEEWRN